MMHVAFLRGTFKLIRPGLTRILAFYEDKNYLQTVNRVVVLPRFKSSVHSGSLELFQGPHLQFC